MMKAYPDYKDSGVEWLGKVPRNWVAMQVKHLFTRVKRTGYENEELLSVYRDYGVIPKSSRDDNHNKASDDLSPYQLVCVDDVVINKMKAWQGSIAVSNYQGIVSPAYHVYEPLEKSREVILPSYAHFLLRHPIYITQYIARSKGIRVNQWDLEPDQFREIELLLPSLPEQKSIVDFLDVNTTRIDNLIAEKESFIKLLQEKRQALISHVVTKGIDDNVKMKPSGVEWIGEIPEHWKVKRFRHLFSLGKGLTITKEHLQDRGIPCVNYGEIHSKYNFELDIEKHPLKYVDESYIDTDPSSLTGAGGFVFADTSEDFDGCGNFTHLLNDARVFAGYHTIIGRLEQNQNSRYISYFLDSSEWRNQIRRMVKGVKVFSISQKILKDTVLFIPSEDEQNRAVEYLDRKIRLIKELEQETTDSIKLLKEHRTALISAAVTGKIDVREEA